MTYFTEEPCDNVSKDNSFVGLVIVRWRGDTGQVPKIRLPFVQPVVARSRVEQEDSGSTFDEPSTVDELDASLSHGGNGVGEGSSGGSIISTGRGVNRVVRGGEDKRCR
jgi:hypothetical protein